MVHQTVLLYEAVESLKPRDGGVYVDCTLGGGGHTQLILENSSPSGKVIGIDQDSSTLQQTAAKLERYRTEGRLLLAHANFERLAAIVAGFGFQQVDGVLFDLGFSSFQVDDPERGFSFRHDAPLDMRMDESQPTTAADLVNTLPETELYQILRDYGEERWAGRIARKICEQREVLPILTTGDLVEIIMSAYPVKNQDGTHPARRTFQALRIAVNRELERLSEALKQAVDILAPGGRVAVISFHSLEDRIVKNYFKREASACICPPELPVCQCDHQVRLKIVTKKPIIPSHAEVAVNPRARSAKLRVAERVRQTPGHVE